MRLLLPLLFLVATTAQAQLEMPAEPSTLPAWMQQMGWEGKPVPYTLPKRAPLHTNAFIGTWSVQKQHGRRFDFWSDKHRVVIQEFDQQSKRKRWYFIDLAANVRMNAHTEDDQALFIVEDMHVPQVGYFREIWSETVQPTGRTETISGAPCEELLGIDGNNDTTYYWHTDQHAKLFADMKVWAPWLCREGELEFLSALSDTPAGGCMRATWPKRRFGPEAGSISMSAITPGATPMPTITASKRFVAERRFLWNNSSGIGTLPAWMRAYVSDLKPDSLPAAYTPKPVKRDIPDNRFIGTFTAETPTMIIGLPDKRTGRDTTHRLAKYSYWADARRAVLIMDDPDDEGYLFYAVDLDADVVMASHNEMHSHVVPKLYISTLEEVGLKEFGRGLELDFTPRGHTKSILGRECELYTTNERFLSQFWFPKKEVLNPVFDMQHWMVQRMGQKMKDLMLFGVADKPMPMAVMGTHLTSYKLGKANPPVADLRYYRVKDERLERRRRSREEYNVPEVRISDIRDAEMSGTDMVPDMVVAEPGMGEAPMMVMEPSPPPVVRSGEGVGAGSGTGSGSGGSSGAPPSRPLPKELESVMARTTNEFIGTALIEYTLTNSNGIPYRWTVRYASTAERMSIVAHQPGALPAKRTCAVRIDRPAGTQTWYRLRADSTLNERTQTLDTRYHAPFAPAHPDSLTNTRRKVNGRICTQGIYATNTTRRETWSDPKVPSLYLDVLSALKGWGAADELIYGGYTTSTTGGMPMEVDYTYTGGDHLVMKVLELKPGPVDPKVFEITKESWR